MTVLLAPFLLNFLNGLLHSSRISVHRPSQSRDFCAQARHSSDHVRSNRINLLPTLHDICRRLLPNDGAIGSPWPGFGYRAELNLFIKEGRKREIATWVYLDR